MAKQTTKLNKRTIGAIWLLVGPSILLFLVFFLFAISNWFFGITGTTGSNSFTVIINVFLWLLGVIGLIAWLPGLILGIVLLATKPVKK